VVSAGAIHELFFQYNPDTNISVEGQPLPGPHQPVPQLIGDAVSGDYFQTMGVPLLSGRLFNDQDGPDKLRVTVINETMAREFFRGEDPVGKRFVFGTPNPDGENRWITVVGVVGDMRRQGLETAAIAQMFGPLAQFPNSRMDIVVRFAALESGRRPNELTAAVLGELRHIEKRAVISGGEVVAKELAGLDAWRTFQTCLLSVFSAIALLLAAMGVYGLLQQAVLQRRREIGVRIALGAQPGDVRRLILRDAMALVLGGLALGVAASVAAAPVLQSLLYGVAANDPLTLGVTSALLFLSAAAATYLPVRRATGMDPITTLRED
jgi:putative ABC transport system permease protein